MVYDIVLFIAAFSIGLCVGYFLNKSLHLSLQDLESQVKKLVSLIDNKK